MNNIMKVILYTIVGVILAMMPFICVLSLFTGAFGLWAIIIYCLFGSLSAICLIKASIYAGNESKWKKTFHLIMLTIIFFPIGLCYLWQKDHNIKKLGITSGAILLLIVIGIAMPSPPQNDAPSESVVSVDRSVQPSDGSPTLETTTEASTQKTAQKATTTNTTQTATEASTQKTAETTTQVTTAEKTTQITTTKIEIKPDIELGINYPRPKGNPPLTVGSSGDEVCWVQEALNRVLSINMIVDGSYGNGTASKVTEFQERCYLNTNGTVDIATVNRLVKILSGEMELPEPKVTVPPTTQPIVIQPPVQNSSRSYVVNTNSGKFHYPSCSSVGDILPSNRWDYTGSRDELIAQGYIPCKRCDP